MTQNAWSESLTDRVARAVRSARGSRSAQEIADETARLGYPMTRSQIANLESGRKRSVDIAELIILAAALGVPPVALLFPDLPDGDVEDLPGQLVSSAAGLVLFTGEHGAQTKSDAGRLVKLSRQRFDKQAWHSAALGILEDLAAKNPEQVTADRITGIADLADEVRELDRQIAAIPGAVLNSESSQEDA
jgi:transcriptional regulator with XRE-family HTH domain